MAKADEHCVRTIIVPLQLEGGMFFTLDCIRNYELIRELCSYGKDLIVLSDGDVKKDVMKRIQEMNDKYLELQTK